MCVACYADGVGSKRNDENVGRRKTDFIFQEEWREPGSERPSRPCGRGLTDGDVLCREGDSGSLSRNGRHSRAIHLPFLKEGGT